MSEIRNIFVSYNFAIEGGGFGFGSCSIRTNAPITGHDRIMEFTDEIRKENPKCKGIAILFWREFEPPPPVSTGDEQRGER